MKVPELVREGHAGTGRTAAYPTRLGYFDGSFTNGNSMFIIDPTGKVTVLPGPPRPTN